MKTITIAKREIPLIFNMSTWCDMAEMGLDLPDLEKALKGKKRVESTLILLCAEGNEGLRKIGKEADLTVDWLKEHLNPRDYITFQMDALNTITEGMNTEEEDDGKPVDVTLRELSKNAEAGK